MGVYKGNKVLAGSLSGADVVKISGDQTISGKKIFSTSVEVPTPTSMTESTNKAITTAYLSNKIQVVDALPQNPTDGVFYFVKEQ